MWHSDQPLQRKPLSLPHIVHEQRSSNQDGVKSTAGDVPELRVNYAKAELVLRLPKHLKKVTRQQRFIMRRSVHDQFRISDLQLAWGISL